MSELAAPGTKKQQTTSSSRMAYGMIYTHPMVAKVNTKVLGRIMLGMHTMHTKDGQPWWPDETTAVCASRVVVDDPNGACLRVAGTEELYLALAIGDAHYRCEASVVLATWLMVEPLAIDSFLQALDRNDVTQKLALERLGVSSTVPYVSRVLMSCHVQPVMCNLSCAGIGDRIRGTPGAAACRRCRDRASGLDARGGDERRRCICQHRR